MKDNPDYKSLCKTACDIAFDSLRFARRNASQPWRYLASFAASGKIFHHSSCYTDRFWQSVFLSIPKKRPQIVTQERHYLSILKAYFCFYVYGKSSALYIHWMTYSHSLSPSADEDLDFRTLPDLLEPLIDL